MPCDICKNEQRIVALEKDIERNTKTHRDFYDRFEELNINGARSDEKYANILTAIARLETQVSELVAKPSRRWEAVIAAIIAASVGVAIGYFV